MQLPHHPPTDFVLLRPFTVVVGLILATGCGSLQLNEGGFSNGPTGNANTQAANGNTANSNTTAGTLGARSNCKRGMASGTNMSHTLSPNDMNAVAPGISWWYDWGTTPDNANVMTQATQDDVEFVPMVFGGPTIDVNSVLQHIPASAKYILGFNEPNFNAQGNLTPQQAAALWPQIEQIAHARNLKIVSPAMNYCGGGCNETDPFTWLNDFFAACQGCQVDAIAFHAYVCYESALNSSGFLQGFEAFGKPVWLTEFACEDTSSIANDPNGVSDPGSQASYMKASVAMLEADPNVQRYSWFIARSTTTTPVIGLLGNDGQLTDLGKLYVSLPQACDPN